MHCPSQPTHCYNLRKPGPGEKPYKRRQLTEAISLALTPVKVSQNAKINRRQAKSTVTIELEKTSNGFFQISNNGRIRKPVLPKPMKMDRLLFASSKGVTFHDLAEGCRKARCFPLVKNPTLPLKNEPFFDLNGHVFTAANSNETTSILQERTSNDDEAEDLEIVDNRNQKIKIKVSGLTGKTSLRSFETVPNPIDTAARQENFDSQRFNLDFRSGYAPIEIQQTQERDFKDNEKKEKTQHFIKKKQSCAQINLKRTCGVSYVKPTESQQLNVSNVFEPLPPLVFQCSSECDEVEDVGAFQGVFKRLFTNGARPLVCTLLDSDDDAIRDYLLKPEKRVAISKGRVLLIRDYRDLWPLFFDKMFIIIHFFHDKREIIVNHASYNMDYKSLMDLIVKSQFQLGVQLKKNLSGKKSFIKTLGTEFNRFVETPDDDNPQLLDFDAKVGLVSSLDDIKPNPKLAIPASSAKEKPKFLTSIMNKLQSFFTFNAKPEPTMVTESTVNDYSTMPTGTNSVGFSTANSSPAKVSPNALVFGVHPSILNYLQKDPKMKNINTISVRMELYIEEALWKSLKDTEKNQLNGLILHIDDAFQREALPMSNKRIEASESTMANEFHDSLAKISIVTKDSPIAQSLKMEEFLNKSGSNDRKAREMGSFGLPLYYISTRDCFAFDLIEKKTVLQLPGRPNVLKTEYFFHPKAKPQNFKSFEAEFPDLRVGVTSYSNFFSHEELIALEAKTFETEIKCFKKHFLPMTAQATFTSEKVRRTKFFFGVRYMWSKQQIAEPFSNVAAGVRHDVSQPPPWLRTGIEQPLVHGGIIPKDFVNSITMNVYHDGKEGLAQHFDDAVRFKQPIFSVRLFSDCRLSFGSQFYGFCNGAFCVPLPRGCIAVLEENSYAANGVKHCVRPCDMTGKSAAIILRQMHEGCLNDAKRLAEFVDLPAWFSTLSTDEKAISYDEQKRIEAEMNLAGGCGKNKEMASY